MRYISREVLSRVESSNRFNQRRDLAAAVVKRLRHRESLYTSAKINETIRREDQYIRRC